MPFFSLSRPDVGFLIISSKYVKNLLMRPLSGAFPSSMFMGFGDEQQKMGEFKRPMFENADEAIIYHCLNERDTALRQGVYLIEAKTTAGNETSRFARSHYQYSLQHEEVELMRSILRPTTKMVMPPSTEALASRIHKTCTLAIEPVEPYKLAPASQNPVQHWSLSSGLTSVILPNKPVENVVERDRSRIKL